MLDLHHTLDGVNHNVIQVHSAVVALLGAGADLEDLAGEGEGAGHLLASLEDEVVAFDFDRLDRVVCAGLDDWSQVEFRGRHGVGVVGEPKGEGKGKESRKDSKFHAELMSITC